MSLNRATLIGRVGKDPEIKTTQSGSKVASFSVATSESWTSKRTGEREEKTQWHNIVVWDERLIDNVLAKYVHKGDEIFVEGQIETRKWQDKEGHERYSTEIIMKGFNSKLVLLSGKKSGGDDDGGGEKSEFGRKPAAARAEIDDDIPF